jgi:hypothetical protein
MEQNFDQPQVALSNSTAVLVLGIISIPACCCYGLLGIILAIIALVLAGKASAEYASNPALYTEGSFKNLNAGKICAWIGLALSVLLLIFYIVLIASFGWETLQNPELLQERLDELMRTSM